MCVYRLFVCVYIYMCMCVYIYIYIYILGLSLFVMTILHRRESIKPIIRLFSKAA